jgi:hypothetical protein
MGRLGCMSTYSSRRHGRRRRGRDVGIAVTGGVSIAVRAEAMSGMMYRDMLVAKLTSVFGCRVGVTGRDH